MFKPTSKTAQLAIFAGAWVALVIYALITF